MAKRDYEGPGIVVHWDSDRCWHSERCFRGSPAVFDPQARPWVQPGNEPADALAATIDTCPSAALTYTRTDGAPHGPRGYAEGEDPTAALTPDASWSAEASHGSAATGDASGAGSSGSTAAADPVEAAVSITPREDGPLVVEGPVALTAPDGSTTTEPRLFLCRCGGSSTKPRCDGTHKRIGFQADGTPVART